MLKSFVHYYKPHWKLFAFDMVCALVASACDLMYPVISRDIINTYIPNKNLQLIFTWCLALLLIYVVQTIMQYFMQYQGHLVGVRMQADMRRDVFEHLQKLPFSYFDEHKTGVIMSRIVNDLMDISEFSHHGPEDLFISGVTIIGSFIILCTINIPLTLLTFAVIPFLIWFIVKKRTAMNLAFRKNRVEIAEVNASLENSIAGVRVARAFTGESEEEKKFAENNKRYVTVRERSYRVMAEFFSGNNFLTSLMNIVILAGGGYCVYRGTITVGDMVAYMLFVNMFVAPIKKLIQFVEMFQNAITGYTRFQELMAVPIEEEAADAKTLTDVQGEINFDNVTFQYDEGKEVLSNISLNFPKGKMVAIVGPSGGGKTTLCHLIPRFYDATAGQVMVDGVPVTDYPFSQLRGQIGVVPQQAVLFAGTLRENMQWRKRDASDEEISRALEIAQAAEFVSKLPEGLDTMIQQGGRNLSGGQRQRLTIARALVGTPQILILDDSASALDFATDAALRKALRQQTRDMTVFMVSQRAGTVRAADRIVVLDDGRIVGIGPHSELFETCAVYREICLSQMNEEEAAG